MNDLAPMGIRTVFEADDPGLLAAARAAYAAWVGLPAADHEAPLRIRLALGPASTDRRAADVRVDGARLTIDAPGTQGRADAATREAWCTVPPALAADPERLAEEVLDTLVLFLLTRAGRIPVHAAGVRVGDRAVVLAGPSGTGKSTLALAALRAGLPVLSDDTVYVQLAPRLRVWGLPRPIHVFPRDAPAGENGSLRLRSGRWKAAVALPDDAGRPRVAERAAICLLERGGRVALHPVTADEAVERMAALVEPGFDHFRDQLPAAVRALAAGGAWRLTLSADPGEAIRVLREVVAAG